MKTLYIVPIEPIETRYTKQWYKYFPDQFRKNTNFDRVVQIEVPLIEEVQPDSSSFLNFGATVSYKSSQMIEISRLFQTGQISEQDVFLFTDYWNPAAGFIRYMAGLMGMSRLTIIGIAHAGIWDKHDMLGRAFDKTSWGKVSEEYLAECYNMLFFATEFSKNLFLQNVACSPSKCFSTGFPMEYMYEEMPNYWSIKDPPIKENRIVFPHRKAPEKGIDYFINVISPALPLECVVALDVVKSKKEYYDLLYTSKLTISFAEQETLGISMGVESLAAQCFPLVPDRLSYAELYRGTSFTYFSDVSTEDLIAHINNIVDGYDRYVEEIRRQRNKIDYWFKGTRMYAMLNQIQKSFSTG